MEETMDANAAWADVALKAFLVRCVENALSEMKAESERAEDLRAECMAYLLVLRNE